MMEHVKSGEQYRDEEVISRVLAGEVGMFEILIRRYNAVLYKVGRSYHYAHEDTEDLMQDTFVDAYMNLSSFANRSSFKTWLIRIMLNNCFKKQHRYATTHEVAQEIGEDAEPLYAGSRETDTVRSVINNELNTLIEQGLSHLPLAYRIVFSLREISGLNVAETAESLGISEANVKVRLNRAKVLLRKELVKTYSAEDIYEFNLIYCDRMVERVLHTINTMSCLHEDAHRLTAGKP